MTTPAAPAVAVIGLGYVGLPLAVALAKASPGERIVGFDIDAVRVDELARGHERTGEVAPDALKASRLAISADRQAIIGAGIYIIAVPTPVDAENRPDLSAVLGACALVGEALAASPRLDPAPIVVLESSVYPGVTEDVCGPEIARASGLERGRDFFLGYSPERVNPGDRSHGVERIVKVVAGETPAVAERLARLYRRATSSGVFVARDIRTAEAAKAIENAQRDINIAFINEVAMILGRLGLSTYDVLEAARTKWNFLDFRPGLVGGHCIGVDPYYLAYSARAAGHDPEIILAGRRINDQMGFYMADRIADALGPVGNAAPRTLVLGLTFKEDVPDLRNSKVVDLIEALRRRGHVVAVHDAEADAAEALRLYGLALLPALGAGGPYDCLVGAVPHEPYRRLDAAALAALVKPAGLVADIKGMWRNISLPPAVRRWEP